MTHIPGFKQPSKRKGGGVALILWIAVLGTCIALAWFIGEYIGATMTKHIAQQFQTSR